MWQPQGGCASPCHKLGTYGRAHPVCTLCAPLYLNKVLSQKGHEQCQAMNLLPLPQECPGSSQRCDKGRQIRPCATPYGVVFCKFIQGWHNGDCLAQPVAEGSDEMAPADGQSSLLRVHRSTTAQCHEGRVLSPAMPGTEQLQALKRRVKYCTQQRNFLKYPPEWRV